MGWFEERAGLDGTVMSQRLDDFIPFHDGCAWTFHAMTNHLVGVDADGVWASCYGDVRWQTNDSPDRHHALVTYQDRLLFVDDTWLIDRRALRMVATSAS